jgi:hypothetical protein
MEHLRGQITKTIKAALNSAGVKTIDSIYKGIDNVNLPVTYVNVQKYDNDLVGIGDIALRRDFFVSVTLLHSAYQGTDEVIDEILLKSEKAIINDPKLNDKCHQISVDITTNDEGQNLLKIVNQLYQITVFTSIDGSDQELI